VACGDQTATQYVGTTMNDAAPETSATFMLTLYSRTDTSFAGILELGPPATGGGSAYVWYDGPVLRIVSVAAAGNDTILWTSKLADDGLGGRFEVTGGTRKGQHGTWRASLTKGLPVTPANLRRPRTLAPPPVSALWSLLLLIVSGWWLARWIRRTPQPVVGDAAGATTTVMSGETLSGISGWLLLFVLAQASGIIFSLVRLGQLRPQYDGGMGVGAAVPGMQPLVVLEVAMQLIAPIVALAGAIMIVRRDRYAPRYWFGYFILSAAYLLLDLLLTAPLDAEVKRLLGAAYVESTTRRDALDRNMMRQIVISLIWAAYWVRSRRVRATFGAAALDRHAVAVPVTSVVADPLLPAPDSPRRWRRVVLRTGGTIVAGVVALVAIGFWEMSVRPYSVPAGADIRKTVAGRWTWTTDKEGCANAHIISFSGDGKVMTIVQPSDDIAAPDQLTTTYDISRVTQSAIRGAIRGEKRLRDDGKPVVWDLVLVGPDEYRWRRTDWVSPWGYTPGIVRCPADSVAERASR
jgi:hypothetical protein